VWWVLGTEPASGAEVGDASGHAGPVPELPEGRVVDEAHLLLEARRGVGVQCPGVVRPQAEPPLSSHPAAARRRGLVGLGEPSLQVGAGHAGDQDDRMEAAGRLPVD